MPARVAGNILKELAHAQTQAILTLLHAEPSYPRKVARILSLPETEVARRLRSLEQMGLVESSWQHVGKNVKVYAPIVSRAEVRLGPAGVTVELFDARDAAATSTVAFDPFPDHVPEADLILGREKELEVLAGTAPVVIVEGLPGIGKTSLLASHAAGLRRDDVYWQTLSGLESVEWFANTLAVFHARRGDRRLLDTVEARPSLAALHGLVLEALDAPGVTIVLDDAHRIDDSAVRDLLTDAVNRVRQGRLLIGTRERVPHRPDAAVQRLRLHGIADEAIEAFFAAKGVAFDPALLPRVHAEVGGHPMALNLFIETVKAQQVPVEALLDMIPEEDLEGYLLQEIYEGLGEAERKALGHASLFRDHFTADDLAAVLGTDPLPVLARLRAGLLVQAGPDGFRLHEVVRNLFYHVLQDRNRLHEKVAKHYLARDDLIGRIEALHHFQAAARRDLVLDILREDLDLHEYDLIDSGYHNLYWNILATFARQDVHDDHVWALIEDERGDILLHREEPEAALRHYDAARAIFEKARKEDRIADVAWKRSLALWSLGRDDEAELACRAGLDLAPGGEAKERLEAALAGQR